MSKTIKTIWIESEENGPVTGGQISIDNNTDVIITFTDERKYVATFFTYQNIRTLAEENKRTDECLSGKYFWASDMILIENIDRDTIEKVIDELIKGEEFQRVFKYIG